MTSLQRACVLAIAAPFLVVTLGVFWISVGEQFGRAPLAGAVAANSAEAAAAGSAGDVFRFLRAGEDPHRVYRVRPELISSAIVRATTLEAAMWSREIEMIELLEREGAITDADRLPLACLARDLQLDDIAAHLVPDGSAECERGRALGRVAARSSEANDGE